MIDYSDKQVVEVVSRSPEAIKNYQETARELSLTTRVDMELHLQMPKIHALPPTSWQGSDAWWYRVAREAYAKMKGYEI
jgi:hypothetical protein